MLIGTIRKLVSGKSFGFIEAKDGVEYFFHASSLARMADFAKLIEGQEVSFEIGEARGGKGPRADKVRAL